MKAIPLQEIAGAFVVMDETTFTGSSIVSVVSPPLCINKRHGSTIIQLSQEVSFPPSLSV